MAKILHILNGDTTAKIFSQSGIPGETLIWREMLCDGPAAPEVGSDLFWKKRYDFFETQYGVEKLTYFDKTLKEIIRIEDTDRYDELVLWFEYDLFCQVNLIAALSYILKHYKKDIRYFLVCTGEKDRKTLSDFSADEYTQLYEQKIRLSRNDLLLADESWKIFVQNDPKVLSGFDFNRSKKLRCLAPAMKAHLSRFPDASGLNRIEKKIIELAATIPEEEIVTRLLQWQKEETIYGFGDLQYRKYVHDLKQKGLIYGEN